MISTESSTMTCYLLKVRLIRLMVVCKTALSAYSFNSS